MIAAVVALLGAGAVMIFSTTARGDGPLVSQTFVRQMIYVAIGIACACFLARTDYRRLIQANRFILAIAVVFLILVLIPGVGTFVNGARRWLRIGPVGFQPSEFAKLACLIFLAAFLGERYDSVRSFRKSFLPVLAIVGVTSALILAEPDIGTTALLCAVTWIVLFVAGARLTFLLAPVPLVVPLAIVLAQKDYVWRRLSAWIDPWQDPSGTGYHIIQSMIAVGSGGTWGRGMGASTQKLYFLPEASSDFIFAVLAEEQGLVGATVVICLYAAFVWAGIAIARRAADPQGRLLAVGITTMIGLQAFINIAVVTKVLPTKGIPLPFISVGGSAAVFLLMGVGLLYSVARYSNPTPDEDYG